MKFCFSKGIKPAEKMAFEDYMKGKKWCFKLKDYRLSEMQVSYGSDFIQSLSLTCCKGNDSRRTGLYGISRPNGDNQLFTARAQLDYKNDEVIKEVNGVYRDGRLVSFTILTNKDKTFGPFGANSGSISGGQRFRYDFSEGNFNGFYGTVFNERIHALGVLVKEFKPY